MSKRHHAVTHSIEVPDGVAFPMACHMDADGLYVRFAAIPPAEFTDAFCGQTILRFGGAESAMIFYPWKVVEAFRPGSAVLAPTGLIYHAARVGSTLCVRVLRCVDRLVVYPEPPVFNDLLMPPWKRSRSEILAALRLLSELLVKHAGGRFVVKLRSWNSLFAETICEAFPETPWIFCVRHPVEIGVSLRRYPTAWMRFWQVSANPFDTFAARQGETSTKEKYFAAMFAAFCSAIEGCDAGNGLLVEYPELPSAVWEVICPHFGIRTTSSEREHMSAVLRLEAKSNSRENLFNPDTAEKQSVASSALVEAVEAVALGAMARLSGILRRASN